MPKGQTPRQNSLVKLEKMDKELKNATSQGFFKKMKNLLDAYTTGYEGEKESPKVKAMRRRIAQRQDYLRRNANKLEAGKSI